MLETFYDLDELELAIEAVRSVSSLPIVALMSFDSDAETLAGVSARDAGDAPAQLDVAAFGANHGRGPAAALTALAEMAGDGATLAALPNVGLATHVRRHGSCTRTRRPSTSPSSPRTRATSARR